MKTNHDPERIAKRVMKVASLPEIYFKINDAINSARSSMNTLADILSDDPALSAKLLKLANSSFYNFASKVDTVSKAVTIIGTQQLRDLVLANSVLSAFKNVPEDLVNMELFWRHSIACGLASRTLAALRRENNVERFFVAGLLHDVGRLILYMLQPSEILSAIEMSKEKMVNLYEAEKVVFGFEHGVLASYLLKGWRLPDRLVNQVAYHHKPELASGFHVDASVVHVADIIANGLNFGSSGECLVPKLSEKSWEVLTIQDSQVCDIIERVYAEYDDAVSFILGE